ncbi:MAG: ferritin family protein [Desulfuromonadaceae bacterium]|jgi:rubrerythrin|nr:ferritin family protein [Desulfuromonas sp.]MDY0184286.1 ferritin family protein [Desulfuromonadaceae bacterium]
MDVFEFAKKMEMDGKNYYLQQAEKISIPGLQNLFRRLAEDEQKHYNVLVRLEKERGATSMDDSPALDEAKNVFEELIASAQKPTQIEGGDLEGYRRAMKLEADSYRFYEQAAAQEQDENVRELLLRIAKEEHKHFNILESVYEFVNAPNQYFVWGEFSNLREFHQFGRDVDIPAGKP